jgi:uncharacterized membrane protein
VTAWTSVAALVVVSVVLTVVGGRAARGRLPRGHVVGLRTSATLASEEAWRVGNEVAGAHVVLVGAGGLFASLGTLAVTLAGAGDDVVGLISAVTALVIAGGAVAAGVRGHRAARAWADVAEDQV